MVSSSVNGRLGVNLLNLNLKQVP